MKSTTITVLAAAALTLAAASQTFANDHQLGEGIVSAAYVKQHYPVRPSKGQERRYDNVIEKIITVYPDGRAAVVRKLFYKNEPATYRNVGAFTSYHQK